MSRELELEPFGPLPFPLEQRAQPPEIRVVIPVFNEEQVIERTYDRLSEVLDGLGVSWSVVFVNDGSEDGTIRVLEALFRRDDRVAYVLLSRNFGHQSALAAGLDYPVGSADVVVMMDADLQHPPEMIPTLLEGWRRGYDVVHTRKLSTDDQSVSRSLVTRVAYSMIRRIAHSLR